MRGQSIVISGKEDKKTFLYTHGNSVYIRNIEVRIINKLSRKYLSVVLLIIVAMIFLFNNCHAA